MLTEQTESNIEKVLEWFDEDHSRYPAAGAGAIAVSQLLGVSPGEVNIANRRVALDLRLLKVKKPAKPPINKSEDKK